MHILKKTRKLLEQETKLGVARVPKFTILGVASVIFMYIGVAGIVSTTSPWWLGRGDAPRHIDYVWRVYNKELPKFSDEFQQKDLNRLARGIYKDQPAASNPPLFYAIHAPFIGPSLASGEWQKATAIGRVINLTIGVLCILALAWGGWVLGGKMRNELAVAVPALSALFYHFTVLNLNFAVDVLLILFSTLALIITAKIISEGYKKTYITGLALVSAAGMATKVSYLMILLATLAALALTPLTKDKFDIRNLKKTLKNFRIPLLICGVVVLTVLVAIGWFYYYQNYKSTGSFISSQPANYPNSRVVKSFNDVIFGQGLWSLLYDKYSPLSFISVSLTSFAVAGIFKYWDGRKLRLVLKNKKSVAVFLLMFCAFLAIFTTQIKHSVGTGGYYHRYLLPVMLPIGMFLGYGLLQFKKLRGQLVTTFALLLGASAIYTAVKSRSSLGDSLYLKAQAQRGTLARIDYTATLNGVPDIVWILLLVGFFIGAATLSLSLYFLSNRPKTLVN